MTCSSCGDLPAEITRTTLYDDGSPPGTFPPAVARLVQTARTQGELAAVGALATPIGRGADLLRCPECESWFERSDSNRSLMGGPEYDVETTIARISPAKALLRLHRDRPDREALLRRVETLTLDPADRARLFYCTERWTDLAALLREGDAGAAEVLANEAVGRALPTAIQDALVGLVTNSVAGKAASEALWWIAATDSSFDPAPLCVLLEHADPEVSARASSPLWRHFENRLQRPSPRPITAEQIAWAVRLVLAQPSWSVPKQALRAFSLEDHAARAAIAAALDPHRAADHVLLLIQQLDSDNRRN